MGAPRRRARSGSGDEAPGRGSGEARGDERAQRSARRRRRPQPRKRKRLKILTMMRFKLYNVVQRCCSIIASLRPTIRQDIYVYQGGELAALLFLPIPPTKAAAARTGGKSMLLF